MFLNYELWLLWSSLVFPSRSWDRGLQLTFIKFFQVYQQDATLYNILYYCQCSTCFRRFLRPSSGAQNCTRSIWYMSSLLAATASSNKEYCITLHLVGILERIHERCTVPWTSNWPLSLSVFLTDHHSQLCTHSRTTYYVQLKEDYMN